MTAPAPASASASVPASAASAGSSIIDEQLRLRIAEELAGSFKGRVELDRVGWIGLSSIGGVDARVFDPEGHRVLDLRGARVRVSPWATVRSLVGKGGLVVRLPEIDVDGAEAVVEQDAAGQIGLLRAFEPRTAPVTEQPSTTTIDIGHIHLGHAWVHGHLSAVPVLDADLDDFSGKPSMNAHQAVDVGSQRAGEFELSRLRRRLHHFCLHA